MRCFVYTKKELIRKNFYNLEITVDFNDADYNTKISELDPDEFDELFQACLVLFNDDRYNKYFDPNCGGKIPEEIFSIATDILPFPFMEDYYPYGHSVEKIKLTYNRADGTIFDVAIPSVEEYFGSIEECFDTIKKLAMEEE